MLFREVPEKDQLKIGRLFTSKQGAEVLEILSRVFYYTVSFTPGQANVTAFKEGQRDIVQVLRTTAMAVQKLEEENR